MDTLLGIDIGTSACKAIAIDVAGKVLAKATRPISLERPRPGWAEQRPEDWRAATAGTIRDCVEAGGVRPGSVLALSLTGPAHCVALLDGAGRVLRPTIHWSDARSVPQCEVLEKEWGEEVIFAITGQRAHPSWTLPQLLWLREEEPEVWRRLAGLLTVKDYVRYCMTGSRSTDPYDAVGTMLCNFEAGAWSESLLQRLGLRRAALPPIAPAGTMGGRLTEAAARDTGLLPGTPVAVGSGDSAVEAFGAGLMRPGDCSITLGTSANANIVTRELAPSRVSMAYPHFIDEYGLAVMATNSGASSLRWFRESFFPNFRDGDSRAADLQLMEIAAAVPAGADGLLFHPYLNGERSPHWDSSLRGSFLGLAGSHGLGHFARAVLEGVAYSVRDCIAAADASGEPNRRFVLLGGGSRHALWKRIVGDVLGHPLISPAVADASLGAALLAGVAAGAFASWEAAANVGRLEEETIEPDAEAHATYNQRFAVYRDAIASLRDWSRRLEAGGARPQSVAAQGVAVEREFHS